MRSAISAASLAAIRMNRTSRRTSVALTARDQRLATDTHANGQCALPMPTRQCDGGAGPCAHREHCATANPPATRAGEACPSRRLRRTARSANRRVLVPRVRGRPTSPGTTATRRRRATDVRHPIECPTWRAGLARPGHRPEAGSNLRAGPGNQVAAHQVRREAGAAALPSRVACGEATPPANGVGRHPSPDGTDTR